MGLPSGPIIGAGAPGALDVPEAPADAAEAGGAIEKGTPTPGMAARPGGNAAIAADGSPGFFGFLGFLGFVSSPGCFRGRPRFFGV
jgi:hypothetical protein